MVFLCLYPYSLIVRVHKILLFSAYKLFFLTSPKHQSHVLLFAIAVKTIFDVKMYVKRFYSNSTI